MTISKIAIQPGIYREGTAYSAEGRWYDGDKVRFRSGNAEKIGGWQRLSNFTYLGTARSLWNWVTLAGNNYLGVGTNLKYYIEYGGAYNDITPIRKKVDPMLGPQPPGTGDPFSTAFNTLSADISATQQSIGLTSAASFPPTGGVIRIGAEYIFYNQVSGNTLIGLTRGYDGTVASAHSSGANVACSTLIVTDVDHGVVQNDFVTFSGVTFPFGGLAGVSAIDVNKEHQVLRYIDADRYAIDIYRSFSSAVASGGGAAAIAEYQETTGLDSYVSGVGWGSDPWSSGGWGRAGTVGIGQQLRLWSADNYGEDLVLAPRGGALFYWDATLGLSVRAQSLSAESTLKGFQGQFVPVATNEVVASSLQRFVIAMGANPYDPTDANTDFDPMLVRWSDQENPYEWVPAVTNQSGESRLSHGSYIVTANTTRQEILVWTDSALYSMQYLGAPYVWKFDILMDNLSIISPNATATANNITYWMGRDKFYVYSGRVETLPCDLRQYVFNDINLDQSYQVFSGTNEAFNEVWWFYCSANSTIVDKYVIYNYVDKIWSYGSLNRTAWLDSSLRNYPMAAGYDNRILLHEIGSDDVSGEAPVPIYAYIQSADFDIADGDSFVFIWRMLPDINFNGSNVDRPFVRMQLKPRRNSGAPYTASSSPVVQSNDNFTNTRSYIIQEFDGQVYTRLRGRQMALRIESDELGVAWQIGAIRADMRKDGRR